MRWQSVWNSVIAVLVDAPAPYGEKPSENILLSAQTWICFSVYVTAWWRHQMETFSTILALCAGNSPVTGEFPIQRPVTRSFDVFFDLRLNERLSKQSLGWWFETPSPPLWRHSNGFRIRVCCYDNINKNGRLCDDTHYMNRHKTAVMGVKEHSTMELRAYFMGCNAHGWNIREATYWLTKASHFPLHIESMATIYLYIVYIFVLLSGKYTDLVSSCFTSPWGWHDSREESLVDRGKFITWIYRNWCYDCKGMYRHVSNIRSTLVVN